MMPVASSSPEASPTPPRDCSSGGSLRLLRRSTLNDAIAALDKSGGLPDEGGKAALKQSEGSAMQNLVKLAALACLTLLPATALAHVGGDHALGVAHGFMHPLGGLDHVLAMLAVGLLAWHLRGRHMGGQHIGGGALWLMPSAFLGAMAVGGALGVAGMAVPLVELGIALSVIVVGGLVALGRPLPMVIVIAVVGGFAVFHGHAHGAEMGLTTSGLGYGLGFLTATALLHGMGALVGATLEAGRGRVAGRAVGAAIAIAGIAMVSGAI